MSLGAQEPVPVAVPVEQQNKKQEKIKIWEWNSIYKFTDKGEEAIGFDEAADAEKERIIEKVERVTGKKISDLGKGMTQEGREFESEKEEQKFPKSKIPENKVDEKRKNQLDF